MTRPMIEEIFKRQVKYDAFRDKNSNDAVRDATYVYKFLVPAPLKAKPINSGTHAVLLRSLSLYTYMWMDFPPNVYIFVCLYPLHIIRYVS